MSQEITNITESQSLVSKELNNQIMSVLSNKIEGFEKAFVTASAIQVLKEKLSGEFMKPIMSLQGSRLGFLTDKAKTGGYDEDTVKACLIDAVLLGLQPVGNMYNLIGGNMYVTKEGFGHLLKGIKGLKYNLTFKQPVVAPDKNSANVTVLIDWELNGEKNSQIIDFPMKSNAYASSDALIGKATRKSRAWLFNHVQGTEISDGDAQETTYVDVTAPQKKPAEVGANKQAERVKEHIEKAKTVAGLAKCASAINKETDSELIHLYNHKHIEISTDINELNSTPFSEFISEENDFDQFILFSDKQKELK